MGLIGDFIAKHKAKQYQKSALRYGYNLSFTAFGSDINVSDLVRESIRLKADFCSKLDPRYIRTTDNKQIVISDDNISRMLKNPNPYMTTSDFLYKASFLREVNNNVFIYPDYYMTIGGEKKYTYMYILQPTSWRYYEDDSGKLWVGFAFLNIPHEVVFEYTELIHWRKNFESDDYDGGSDSVYENRDLLNTLQAYRTICESIAEAAKCACYFDGILKVNAYGQKDDAVKTVRDNFIKDLRSGKTGVAVLDNGAEWQDIQRKLTYVDEKTMKHFADKILMHTGVSMAMLSGDFTAAQKEAFYEKCIESDVISLGQAFTKCLFTQWQLSHGSEIVIYPNKIELMSTTEKNSLVANTIAAGIWTKDEIRSMYGAPPLVSGGDTIAQGYNTLLNSNNENVLAKGGTANAEV